MLLRALTAGCSFCPSERTERLGNCRTNAMVVPTDDTTSKLETGITKTMKLSFWIHLLALKQLLTEKQPTHLFYKHWQERLKAIFSMKQNLALTQQHLAKQRTTLHQFETAHNIIAFENPTQTVNGSVFNQLR